MDKVGCMSNEEKMEHFEHFEEIIYDNLLKILESRPRNPVSKYTRLILDDAGLDKHGEPIADREQPPKRKDRKRKIDNDSDEEVQTKKKKKGAEEESEDEPDPVEEQAEAPAQEVKQEAQQEAAAE